VNFRHIKFRSGFTVLIDDLLFELYIPKWRILDPVPGKTPIRIFTNKKAATTTKELVNVVMCE